MLLLTLGVALALESTVLQQQHDQANPPSLPKNGALLNMHTSLRPTYALDGIPLQPGDEKPFQKRVDRESLVPMRGRP